MTPGEVHYQQEDTQSEETGSLPPLLDVVLVCSNIAQVSGHHQQWGQQEKTNDVGNHVTNIELVITVLEELRTCSNQKR